MKHGNIIKQIFIVTLFISCNNKTKLKIRELKSDSVTAENKIAIIASKDVLKVSAYLIYDDNTLSTFDALNDSSKALWNTIIGAGDVVKPSTSTKVIVSGIADSSNIKIFNGKKKVIDKIITSTNGNVEYIIKNTGCEKVDIIITKNKKTLYEKKIPFECGE